MYQYSIPSVRLITYSRSKSCLYGRVGGPGQRMVVLIILVVLATICPELCIYSEALFTASFESMQFELAIAYDQATSHRIFVMHVEWPKPSYITLLSALGMQSLETSCIMRCEDCIYYEDSIIWMSGLLSLPC